MQKFEAEPATIAGAVPTKALDETAKVIHKDIQKLEDLYKRICEKYGEIDSFRLFYILGVVDGSAIPTSTPFVFIKNGKENAVTLAELKKDKDIVEMIFKIKEISKKNDAGEFALNNDTKEIDKLIKAKIELSTIIGYTEIFKKGYEEAASGVILSEEREKPPELKNDYYIELPPTTADFFIYGAEPIYFDEATGCIGTKAQLDLIKKAAAQKNIEGNEELLLYLLPLIGTGYAVVKDIELIREGSDKKIGEIKGIEITEKNIGKAMLVLDISFGLLDVNFIIHLGARSVMKAVARDVESEIKNYLSMNIKEETKKIIIKAGEELDEKNLKRFLGVMAKNPNGVAEEIVRRAGSVENVNKEIIEEFLGSIGKRKIGSSVKNVELLLSREKFMRGAAKLFLEELSNRVEHQSLKVLGQTAKELGEEERRIALKAIFATLSTLDKKAQKAFAEYVKKNGWKYIVEKIKKEKDVIKVLGELFPEYKDAYKYAPLEDVIKTSRDLGLFHIGFVFIQMMGEYISEKKEEEERAARNLSQILAPIVGTDNLPQFLGLVSNIKDKDIKGKANEIFIESYEKNR